MLPSILELRPDHLSAEPATSDEMAQAKVFFSLKEKLGHSNGNWEDPSIPWQSHFKLLNSVKINSRKSGSHPPQLLHVFVCTEAHTLLFLAFTSGASTSSAKLRIQEINSPYPNKSLGYIDINSLNACGEHRAGSTFVQLAIEYSLLKGFDGKIKLTARNTSIEFYLKLGFVPVSDRDYQEICTHELKKPCRMYLPQVSIDIWKRKIARHCILISGCEEIVDALVERQWRFSDYLPTQWYAALDARSPIFALLAFTVPLMLALPAVSHTIYRFFTANNDGNEAPPFSQTPGQFRGNE